MKVEIIEPVVEKDVVITMTMTEAKEMLKFFGGTSGHNLEDMCINSVDSEILQRIYDPLKEALRN
jgi:hypothetical protein